MSCACHPEDASEAAGPGGLSRRAVIAGGVAAGVVPFLPGLAGMAGAQSRDYSFLPPRPASERHVRPMMFPVLPDAQLGRASWSDTYLAPRSGGRLHEGQDLMGNKLLKLLACVSGTIIELRHQSSGNSLYLKGDDGWYYCYLHINNDDPGTDNGANQFKYAYAPGMATGVRVKKGDHIAFLGDSGNAEATGAHCHFEIRMPNEKWYNAAAVNAKYSLDAAEPAAIRAKVGPEAFAPHPNVGEFVVRNGTDFLGEIPNLAWARAAMDRLEGAEIGLDPWIEGLLAEPRAAYVSAPAIRLYLAYFLRLPDTAGIQYWIERVRAGVGLDQVSATFSASSEFASRYGQLDNAGFVTLIYRNLFNRAPDSGGMAHWKGMLDAGTSRGVVMRSLCESAEYRRTSASKVRVIQVYLALRGRVPDTGGYNYWTGKDAAGPTGLQQLILSLRTSAAYAARYA